MQHLKQALWGVSRVTNDICHVIYEMSHVTYEMSHVTSEMHHATFETSLMGWLQSVGSIKLQISFAE